MESTRPRTTLALVNSSGERHSEGNNAECAGRKTTKAIVAIAAKRYATYGGPSIATVAAEAANAPARNRHVQRSTRSRRKRSASAVPTGERIAAGTNRRKATAPTAAGPPSRNATTERATVSVHSPVQAAANDSWARRRFGFARLTAKRLRRGADTTSPTQGDVGSGRLARVGNR